METSTIVWIVVVVVILLALAALIGMAMSKKRKEQHRIRANELREQAAAQATGVQQREADARYTEAEARQARAEADQRAAEAERLEAEASDQETTTATYREARDEHLRQADELDPDVKDDGREADAETGTTTSTSHRADGPTGSDATGTEGQRYDPDGNPIRRDGSHTDVESETGTHRT